MIEESDVPLSRQEVKSSVQPLTLGPLGNKLGFLGKPHSHSPIHIIFQLQIIFFLISYNFVRSWAVQLGRGQLGSSFVPHGTGWGHPILGRGSSLVGVSDRLTPSSRNVHTFHPHG